LNRASPSALIFIGSARFILLDSVDCSDLLLVCHHTICDGMSLVYLIRDIMTFLGDPGMEAEPLPVPPALDAACFPAPAGTGLLPGLIFNHFNKAWKKDRHVFNENDYDRIFKNFWDKEKLYVITHSMKEDIISALASRCRKEGVTVNSAVCTAFNIAQNVIQKNATQFRNTGVAVNLRSRMRETPGEGMGLFAGGNSIKLEYAPGKSFWILAQEFDKKAKNLLADKRKPYEWLLLNKLDQTLIDAVFFYLFGSFENKTAASFAKLMRFDKKTPGLGVSNLGRLDIPLIYGPYRLKTIFFVPPNIPGGEKILGVVTAGGSMNLSLACLQSGLDAADMKAVMDHAIGCIEKAVKA
jgi:NRPS condensation-like uncharacterized protein